MGIFRWLNNERQIPSMSASCSIGETSLLVSICEATDDELVCTFPSCRIESSLMDLISMPATIRIDSTSIEGTLSYYTIEDSTCRVGISVDKRHRSAWRRICAEKIAEHCLSSTRHAHA